jgi:hypothetical protein
MNLKAKLVCWTAFLVLLCFMLPGSLRAQTVQNGGFTTGDFTGWTTQGWGVGTVPPDPGLVPPGTTHAAVTPCVGAPCNDPVSGAWISQNLTTVAGQTYTLSFYYDAGIGSGTPGTTELEALWSGVAIPHGHFGDGSKRRHAGARQLPTVRDRAAGRRIPQKTSSLGGRRRRVARRFSSGQRSRSIPLGYYVMTNGWAGAAILRVKGAAFPLL